MLVMPLSPLLDCDAQQAAIRWFGEQPGRQLQLGPDTALLDRHGRWLPRTGRPLWSWLGVEPGSLNDLKEELEIEGVRHQRFRVLETAGKAEVLTSGKWRARMIPGQIKCRPGVFLHACDWTAPLGAAQGSQAIPV